MTYAVTVDRSDILRLACSRHVKELLRLSGRSQTPDCDLSTSGARQLLNSSWSSTWMNW